jgi:hypothetical protein
MRVITLPRSYTMTVPPLSSINGLKGIEMIEVARHNGMQIISCTLAIEDLMKKVITNTLFSEVKEKKELVTGLILDSEWFSFSACRNLFLRLLQDGQCVTGRVRQDFEKDLSKVMKCRNAFAHGTIFFDGTSIALKYFEGASKQIVLNEEYWSSVESLYLRTFTKLGEIHNLFVPLDENQST